MCLKASDGVRRALGHSQRTHAERMAGGFGEHGGTASQNQEDSVSSKRPTTQSVTWLQDTVSWRLTQRISRPARGGAFRAWQKA